MPNQDAETTAAFEKVTVQIEKISASAPPQSKPDLDELKKLVAKLKEAVAAQPKTNA